jgi:hypothetical protein
MRTVNEEMAVATAKTNNTRYYIAPNDRMIREQ